MFTLPEPHDSYGAYDRIARAQLPAAPVPSSGHRDMTIRLWHGGAPGRLIGEFILPPSITGLEKTTADDSRAGGFLSIAQRRDRVYVTTRRQLAVAFAAAWENPTTGKAGGGGLYRVELLGEAEPDEDLLSLPGLSFQAQRAKVLSVDKAAVKFNRENLSAFQRVIREHKVAESKRVVD
jgi:hypothetical protein